MLFYSDLEHYDNFGDTERVFWVDVSGVPECFVGEAKKIDGADYTEDCFGVCIQHNSETGEFVAIEDKPGQNLYYVDNLGEKHWFDYCLSGQELAQIVEKVRIFLEVMEKENSYRETESEKRR